MRGAGRPAPRAKQRAMRILTAFTLACAMSAAPLPKGDAAKGKELFMPCELCHSPDAWRTGGLLARKGGPSLRHLYSKSRLTTTGKPLNDDTVLEVINNGGKGMVPYKDSLSPQQKADLLAYLKTQ
jgi:mono/diheme cytochrome c family protein